MLTLTDDAVTAVKRILDNAELPESGGMRISRVPAEGSPNTDEPSLELRLSVVPEPEEGDQVVGEQPVFLEPAVADVLDDKQLDADVEGDEVRFMVGHQA